MRPGSGWRAAARGRRSPLILALGLVWAVHAAGQAPPKRLAFDGKTVWVRPTATTMYREMGMAFWLEKAEA